MHDANGMLLLVGDRVIVEKNVEGLVVCDHDQQCCLPGYESWLTGDELVGGGSLSSGIMVETTALGFLHYPEADGGIVVQVKGSAQAEHD